MENSKQRGTGIEDESQWLNGTVHFHRTGSVDKSGSRRKVGHYFRNFSGWTEPIHSVLDGTFEYSGNIGRMDRAICLRKFLEVPKELPEDIFQQILNSLVEIMLDLKLAI